MSFNRILVATDGSRHSARAAEVAAELAATHDAELVLLHVASPGAPSEEAARIAEIEGVVPKRPSAAGGAMLEALPSAAYAAAPPSARTESTAPEVRCAIAERLLEEASARACAAGATRVRKVLEFGDPARQILDATERERADAVVLGSRGLGNVRGMILGSVSREVAQNAGCTCITVREPGQEAA